MKVKEFLDFLDEPEVIEKIHTVMGLCSNRQNNKTQNEPAAAEAGSDMQIQATEQQNVIMKQKQQIQDLQGLLQEKETEIAYKNNVINDYAGKIAQQSELINALQQQITVLNAEKQQLSNELAAVGKDMQALKQQKLELQQTVEQYKAELEERFADGWQLYRRYFALPERDRQVLTSVFPSESFEAFICGGAKDASLEKIWDEVDRNLSSGNSSTAYLLWEIFAYFVKLVNAGKTEMVYQIDDVREGDDYDRELHNLTAGSKVQGKVRQVHLPGFSNIYSGRNIRKSIVYVE